MKQNNISTKEILEQISERDIFRAMDGKLYRKDGLYWKKISENVAAIVIRSKFPKCEQALISSYSVKEVIRRILEVPSMQFVFTEIIKPELLNLRNGVFDVETGNLIPLEDEYAFSYVYDFEFCRDAKLEDAPNFMRFLVSTFPYDTEQKTKFLLQILGYIVSDFTSAKAAFFFVGAPNSGKSLLLELLRYVCRNVNVTGIGLEQLSNRFTGSKLLGSRINLVSEIGNGKIANPAFFKAITSNEIISAEFKGQDVFDFRVKTKLLFAGNVLPELKQMDGLDALLNRMKVLYFPQSIPFEDQDQQLLDRLIEERNIIFSLALEELRTLKNNNFIFIVPKDTEKLMQPYKESLDAINVFINECCILDEAERIYKSDLWNAFLKYVDDNLIEMEIRSIIFFRKLLTLYPKISAAKARVNGGKPKAALLGIRLKTSDDWQDSDLSDVENPFGG